MAGHVTIGAEEVHAGTMAVVDSGSVTLHAIAASRVMVVGGEQISPRHLWWNFVHTSPERIELAKHAWREGEFDTIPGDPERIPLPA